MKSFYFFSFCSGPFKEKRTLETQHRCEYARIVEWGDSRCARFTGGWRDWRLEISPALAEGTDKRTDESEAREREQLGIFAYAHLRTEGVRATIKFTMGAMIVW